MSPYLKISIIKYGSRVSGTIEGKELCPPLHLGVLAIEKGTFGSPSYTCINKYIYIYKAHSISFQTFFYMGTFIDSTHMKL